MFHEVLDSSSIHRPAQGSFAVLVIIREGAGFPLVCKGSHVLDIASIQMSSMEELPQTKVSVVVFDAGLACQNPAVKGGSTAGCGIMLLY